MISTVAGVALQGFSVCIVGNYHLAAFVRSVFWVEFHCCGLLVFCSVPLYVYIVSRLHVNVNTIFEKNYILIEIRRKHAK